MDRSLVTAYQIVANPKRNIEVRNGIGVSKLWGDIIVDKGIDIEQVRQSWDGCANPLEDTYSGFGDLLIKLSRHNHPLIRFSTITEFTLPASVADNPWGEINRSRAMAYEHGIRKGIYVPRFLGATAVVGVLNTAPDYFSLPVDSEPVAAVQIDGDFSVGPTYSSLFFMRDGDRLQIAADDQIINYFYLPSEGGLVVRREDGSDPHDPRNDTFSGDRSPIITPPSVLDVAVPIKER